MNQEEYAVVFDHVSKIYKLKDANHRKGTKNQYFYALRDISFKIKKGEVCAILGTNGSGKSTMSNILAGISEADEGEITVNGRQELIAIQAGLNSQLTGLQNIDYKGALLGLNRKKVEELKETVIEFSEIGDFLEQPVKKYSSGMKSRLGFSISLALDPDIYIVDEALSVGDKGFADKCLKKMNELRNNDGKTIIFISHSLQQCRNFCQTAMWIEGGKLVEYGDIETVSKHYEDYVIKFKEMTGKEKKAENKRKFEARVIEEDSKSPYLKLVDFFRR